MPALGAESVTVPAGRSLVCEQWLWGPRTDLLVFGGSALGALLVVALGHALGFGGGALPDWAFLVFVLGIDVAHVYGTLFRTYLDGAELRARPARYALTPLVAYTLGVMLYAAGAMAFWRALAYLALFHFVRQEIGWLRLSRARSRSTRFDARLDELALYVSSLYPVFVWHLAPNGRHFSWFVPGDFWALPAELNPLLPVARAAWLSVLGVFAVRQLWLAFERGVVRALPLLIVGKTALIWYVGIVYCNSDFDFTVTNVVAHGVPYLALSWAYARQLPQHAPRAAGARIARVGGVFSLAVLVLAACAEEWGWDRFVFHDRAWFFGQGSELGRGWLTGLVPLLAVPQLTHYVLDGKLWRSAETRRLPAQQAALRLVKSREVA